MHRKEIQPFNMSLESWRDREGRLGWGTNDLDEAAEMPYTVDLVRWPGRHRSPRGSSSNTSRLEEMSSPSLVR